MDDGASFLDAIIGAVGSTDVDGLMSALHALAASGIDLSQLTPEQIVELVMGDGGDHAAGVSQVHFGWEGRYPSGLDGNGHEIIQSSTGPPTHANPTQGGDVSPNDVQW